jgi:16S rRNA G966 N2-methylase RsmD
MAKIEDKGPCLFAGTQADLFENSYEEELTAKKNQPVTCLGIKFESDEARRAHFTEELRKKLQDPEFRKIEGFPIGSDENILNLSDPPYYTACPNPWIADFIAEWEAQKPDRPEGYHYHREPFAADVSEGRHTWTYKAHTYHTKVPPKAIASYIDYFADDGDIVLDGFCGSGMTGVSRLHTQKSVKVILNDLSPAATFISYITSSSIPFRNIMMRVNAFLNKVECTAGIAFRSPETHGANVAYTVWSEIHECPACLKDFIFFEEAYDRKSKKVLDVFICPQCSKNLKKTECRRVEQTKFDAMMGKTITQVKITPVLVIDKNGKKRIRRKPNEIEMRMSEAGYDKTSSLRLETFMASDGIWGDQWREGYHLGITHAHHFFIPRTLACIDSIITESQTKLDYISRSMLFYTITSCLQKLSKLMTYNADGIGRVQKGTLYISSLIQEMNPFHLLRIALKDLCRAYDEGVWKHNDRSHCTTTGSSAKLPIPDNCVDYIFVDPPFGSNLAYAELNFLWEWLLGAFTNQSQEAIVSKHQNKDLSAYSALMYSCFSEYYRVLKPGRWMTIEFSNTQSSIWNGIQESLQHAGFIVANVSALDKKQGTYNAINTTIAAKKDLIISAYKPNGGFEERFQKEAQTEEGVWDFVRTHLKYLPVTKQQGALLQFVPERDPRILFDQMVAYYVRKGYPVPISSQEFQIGLAQRFIDRDGMYFLPDQVAEYDRKKMTSGELKQMTLFVSDGASAIQWLRLLIKEKPQTFSDINPQFMQQLGGWSKNEAQLDLRELLNQNFLCYDGKGPVPEQIHAYLSTNWKDLRNLPKDDPTLIAKARDRWYVPDPNKAGDLEKLREKSLIKEFEEYKQAKKKLKVFRLEAVRAGFKKAWQERDYAVIVAVADKIPNNVLEEDPKLLMWFDQAVTRMGGE